MAKVKGRNVKGNLNPRYGDRRQRVNSNCLTCDKPIESFKSRPKKFCSFMCYIKNADIKKGFTKGVKNIKLSDYKRKLVPRVEIECKFCDKIIKVKNSRKGTANFCSNKCKYEFMQKENSPTWKGGLSFEPYGLDFDNKLREQIRKRDGYRCQECFRHQNELGYKLPVHHIDFNKTNSIPENLIALCRNCHTQTNWNREDWTVYYQQRRIESD